MNTFTVLYRIGSPDRFTWHKLAGSLSPQVAANVAAKLTARGRFAIVASIGAELPTTFSPALSMERAA